MSDRDATDRGRVVTPADVGRALVAAPWWEWRAGMLAYMPAEGRHPACTCRIVGDAPFPGISGYMGRLGLVGLDLSAVPDLSDDATAGVLVGMLAATGRLNAIGAPNDGETTWDVQLRDPPSWTTFSGDTLAEAAGRALLAVKGGSP